MSCDYFKITPFTPSEEARFDDDPIGITVEKVVGDTRILLSYVKRDKPDIDLSKLKSEIIEGLEECLPD